MTIYTVERHKYHNLPNLAIHLPKAMDKKHRGKYNFSAIARTVGFISHDFLTRKFHFACDEQKTLLYFIQRVHPFSKGYLLIDDTWLSIPKTMDKKALQRKIRL